MRVKLLSPVSLFAMDYSLPSLSAPGISQAEYWVAISFSRGFLLPRDKPMSPVSPALQVTLGKLSSMHFLDIEIEFE